MVCHNAFGGFARSTGFFFMRLNVAELGSLQATDTYRTGWNQATAVFHQVPDRLAACSTASSCVFDRMSHRDGVDGAPIGTQMPPIDTHVVDQAGVALVAAWINEGCDAGSLLDAGDAASPVDAGVDANAGD